MAIALIGLACGVIQAAGAIHASVATLLKISKRLDTAKTLMLVSAAFFAA
jgi:hypothetical protein